MSIADSISQLESLIAVKLDNLCFCESLIAESTDGLIPNLIPKLIALQSAEITLLRGVISDLRKL